MEALGWAFVLIFLAPIALAVVAVVAFGLTFAAFAAYAVVAGIIEGLLTGNNGK